jgi:hypothetical protein
MECPTGDVSSHDAAGLGSGTGGEGSEVRLAEALESGQHRGRIFADLKLARGPNVVGSPHLFLADGTSVHNPGIKNDWTRESHDGYPVIVSDEPAVWVDLVRRAAQT